MKARWLLWYSTESSTDRDGDGDTARSASPRDTEHQTEDEALTSQAVLLVVCHPWLGLLSLSRVLVTMQTVRKVRRDTTEVSCCLKYVIFSFNVLFWVSIYHYYVQYSYFYRPLWKGCSLFCPCSKGHLDHYLFNLVTHLKG